ncbi:hypothetical protein BDN70DRAFT_707405 [Pholiota conissans]|uniref:Uncharacterized protein n=1 Tax=Pholiota conissans TaxID=109636 RepID=A0A9P5ZBL1_9AGAR|nr:hypothetical protein BDN70DRAFT_707405 [Pholiota conissans]
MKDTRVFTVLSSLSSNKPCILQVRREDLSTTKRSVVLAEMSRWHSKSIVEFLDNGHEKAFLDPTTGDLVATIYNIPTYSDDEGHTQTEMLSATSVGITQLPMSRFLDSMEDIYSGKRVFKMRTPYGAHYWVQKSSVPDSGEQIFECMFSPVVDMRGSNASSSSLLSLFSGFRAALGAPSDSEVLQSPHFDAETAIWDFAFVLRAIYSDESSDFRLEISLGSDIPPEKLPCLEVKKALVHATIIAGFVMNMVLRSNAKQ